MIRIRVQTTMVAENSKMDSRWNDDKLGLKAISRYMCLYAGVGLTMSCFGAVFLPGYKMITCVVLLAAFRDHGREMNHKQW